MANTEMQQTTAFLATYLSSRHVPPTSAWLQTLVPTLRLNIPMVALQKTALFRLLATDLMVSIDKSQVSTFPVGITDPGAREKRLRSFITVQILDIEDIGRSRWSQVDAIEAHERGETTKGREIIRVIPDENDVGTTLNSSADASHGPHKLLLQDARGTRVYGLELFSIPGIDTSTSIGAKLVLKDCVVARGIILLEPKNVEVLGGKIESWDKQWRNNQKSVLKEKAGIRENAA
ncbi:Hypothetical protein R9X50_00075700 [Acrodontium crateriforme]|uniref:RecQ-mediated genome instability protein 1 n=1 Tax=Acrodontium crateriforme TaxID=150365 RepID=A0AAQ3R7H3_9PEZI|nr:Hypothetical protein R9X50_00075700 [Acrodontium crateriforme]